MTLIPGRPVVVSPHGGASNAPCPEGKRRGAVARCIQKLPRPRLSPKAVLFSAAVLTSVATTPATADVLTPEQRAQVDTVSACLSRVQGLSGRFVQVGPDGSRTNGEFHMHRPGELRLEDDPPGPRSIIVHRQAVMVVDRKLVTQDVYPLSQTPLRFLLADRVDLQSDLKVVEVSADDVAVILVIAVSGSSKLLIMVGAKDCLPKQWRLIDAAGSDMTGTVTTVDVKDP